MSQSEFPPCPIPPDWRLIHVEAPHMCAGLFVGQDGTVTFAAPILAWSVGRPAAEVSAYFKRRGWRAYELRASDP